jgi:hypothetical protein
MVMSSTTWAALRPSPHTFTWRMAPARELRAEPMANALKLGLG